MLEAIKKFITSLSAGEDFFLLGMALDIVFLFSTMAGKCDLSIAGRTRPWMTFYIAGSVIAVLVLSLLTILTTRMR